MDLAKYIQKKTKKLLNNYNIQKNNFEIDKKKKWKYVFKTILKNKSIIIVLCSQNFEHFYISKSIIIVLNR